MSYSRSALIFSFSAFLGIILPLTALGGGIEVFDRFYSENTNFVQVQRHESEKGRLTYGFDAGYVYEVHVYETPQGEKGFQVVIYDGVDVYSYGYGPETSLRTFEIKKSDDLQVASTTNEVSN